MKRKRRAEQREQANRAERKEMQIARGSHDIIINAGVFNCLNNTKFAMKQKPYPIQRDKNFKVANKGKKYNFLKQK